MTFFPVFDINIYPFGTWLVTAYVLLTAYAITKTELMDIRVAISRTAAYGTVGILLITSFIILNLIKLPLFLMIGLNALLGLFWAFAAHRLRDVIQTPLEEKWITGWYNSDKLINSIAQKLVPVFEGKDVFGIVAQELKETIKIKNTNIILVGEGLPPGHPLVQYILDKRDVIYCDRLPEEIKESLKDFINLRHCLALPLFSSAKLEGILVLGPKISEDPYNEKDLTLLRTIFHQVIAVFDRLRPYAQIQKELEEKNKMYQELQKTVERSERLASLGGLAAGIAHEIKNPMVPLKSYAQLLRDKFKENEYIQKVSGIFITSIEDIINITEGMLSIAREKEEKKEKIDVNDLLENVLKYFSVSRIALKKEFNALPLILGYRTRLNQVFTNLLKNAQRALKEKEEGGVITLRTEAKEIDGKKYVKIELIDNGCGIPKENLEKIFNPFFTTWREGTGLGLSVSHKIVVDHGGFVEVESKEGEGSRFRVYLPVG